MKIEINIIDYISRDDWREVKGVVDGYMQDYLNYKMIPDPETIYVGENHLTGEKFSVKFMIE